jgi:hypothetical protein
MAARTARGLARYAWRRAAAELGYITAAGDTRSHVHARIEGIVPLGERVCVFVHFDARGVLRAHTRRYLEALAAEGFALVVVDNSPALAAESVEYLRGRCARILLRRNRGYDFGAWRDGLLDLGIEAGRYRCVVLANDSVYAPVGPLGPLFAGMDFARADVWGATDSWQQRYHLQSYLLAFGDAALAHPAFLGFWRNVRNTRSKWAVVRHYEIGLTQALQAGGLRCAAVFDYLGLMQRAEATLATLRQPPEGSMAHLRFTTAAQARHAAVARRALNPTIDLWRLLAEAGSPLLKRELLRDDPLFVRDLRGWHRMVEERAPDLYAEVVTDLKRILRDSAP